MLLLGKVIFMVNCLCLNRFFLLLFAIETWMKSLPRHGCQVYGDVRQRHSERTVSDKVLAACTQIGTHHNQRATKNRGQCLLRFCGSAGELLLFTLAVQSFATMLQPVQ